MNIMLISAESVNITVNILPVLFFWFLYYQRNILALLRRISTTFYRGEGPENRVYILCWLFLNIDHTDKIAFSIDL